MKFHWHWQNLSDEPGRERRGFWHGRAWLRFGDYEQRRPVAKIEWSHGRAKLACVLSFDRDERELQLHVAVPGASYFIGVEGVRSRWFDRLPWSLARTESKYAGGDRSIGVRFFDEKIWLSFWEDGNEWRARDPKWMRATIAPLDILFGKTRYENRVIEERAVKIPMPEKVYEGTAKREVATWTRPRWPWRPLSTRRDRVSIDVPGGIGVPGKGENSWDIDDDAIFGQTSVARTIEEGIGHVIASVLETRRRRGWTDKPKAA